MEEEGGGVGECYMSTFFANFCEFAIKVLRP
jgi:hypothetical protein